MIRFFIICVLGFSCLNMSAQDLSWMQAPVKHKVRLAGTFGELRNNHFHTGLDIKSSNGQVGDDIIAVADGVVRRARIAMGGYGHVLYIDHPNGYTSVYAHLNEFRPDIDSFILKEQYRLKTYELDTTFNQAIFSVKQGEKIGVMGLTGRSYGPHLHFEVRETESEIPINPLFFNMDIIDNIAPKVDYVLVNHLDDKHRIQGSEKINLQKNGNSYSPTTKTQFIPAWRVGLGVFVRDLMTGVSNRNGIYKGELFVDDQLLYSYEMDSISFDEFRYLNAHIDYKHYKNSKHRIHSLYKRPGNKIGIYKDSLNSVIKLYAAKERKIRIELSDYHKNVSTVEFNLLRDTLMKEYKGENYEYYLKHDAEHIINRTNVVAKFPEGCFYDDAFISIKSISEKEENYASEVIHIGNTEIPIHGMYEIYIQPNITDSLLLEKCTVVMCEKSKYISYGADRLGDLIGTGVSSFGTFVLMIDTVPPSIIPKAIPMEVMQGSRLIFQIDDNIQVKGRAHDLRYEAFLDGEWILMKYDLKNKQLIHYVDDQWKPGKHMLELKVWDDRDNVSTWKRSISKK